ncbi:MAG: hypothetical protein RLZZ44_671 [Bacteroidota bacterium]|jgi:hypothetical protein
MKYKKWSDERLISEGKKLAMLLPKAWAYVRKAPQNNTREVYELMKDIEAIQLGEKTLKLLRDEYQFRKSKRNNSPS